MKKGFDKFPIFFILGILVILIITFIILLRSPKPTYTDDSNPQGVIFNYILALKNSDYEKAWSYLSPTLEEFPRNAERFQQMVSRNSYQFSNLNNDLILKFGTTQRVGNRATVTVIQTIFYNSGLFSRKEYTRSFSMDLVYQNNQWKITYGQNFWLPCLNNDAVSCSY